MIYSIIVAFLLFFTCLGSSIVDGREARDGYDFISVVWKFIMSMLALSVAIILIVKVAT